MRIQHDYRQFLLSLALWTAAFSQALCSTDKEPLPNIVLLYSDDQGVGDVGCYGYSEIPTPHIDSIATAGVRLTQFYVSAPVCTPSRFGMLTGMAPNRSRDKLLNPLYYASEEDRKRALRTDEITIASRLKSVGYSTALIGKWHLGHGRKHLPLRHGFDYFYGHTGGAIDYFTHRWGYIPDWFRNDEPIEEEGYATDLITEEAVRWICGRKRTGPFFLYVSYNAPHVSRGWDEEKKEFRAEMQVPEETLRKFASIQDPSRRAYAAMVSRLDDGIGRILETLDQEKLLRDTLIIFLSDNGAAPNRGGSNRPLRGFKGSHLEGGIRVPCVMRFPGRIRPNTTSYQVGSNLDFMPTLAALTGFVLPDQPQDGINLCPALFEERTVERDLVFYDKSRGIAVRHGRWKFMSVPSKDGGAAEESLYELEADGRESVNLAEDFPERCEQLRKLHEDFQSSL